jgi:formylmethanofuran dehydrogenase subunit E
LTLREDLQKLISDAEYQIHNYQAGIESLRQAIKIHQEQLSKLCEEHNWYEPVKHYNKSSKKSFYSRKCIKCGEEQITNVTKTTPVFGDEQ